MSTEAVPKGYKRTEVGVIPEEWEVSNLQSLIDPQRGIRYGIVQPGEFDYNGRFMIRGQDYSTGWADPSEFFLVSAQIEEPFKNARVKTGDLLITIVGASTGRIAVVPEWLDGANLTQTTARISILGSKIDPTYCSYVLASKCGKDQVKNYIKGAAQPGLNCGDVEKFIVPHPELLVEQQAIAAALSDADALIESLESILAKKRQIKQGAMQELLTGKRRLPGFTGKWEPTLLGNLGSFFKGCGVRKDEAQSGVLPCVRYGELYTHHEDVVRRFNSWISEQVASSAFRLRKGDILFAGSGETKAEIGKSASILYDGEAYAGGDIVILRPNTLVSSHFFGYYLNTPTISIQKASFGQGDAVVHIGANALGQLEVLLPTFPEQTAIATVLTDMDAELEALEAKLDKARQVKQGMMQQLLTGKVRLV